MKNFIILVAVMSLAVVANASDAKKANRKPAGAGEVNYVGPFTAESKTGEITITGQAADDIYADMKAVSPPEGSTSGKLTGHNIICTPKNPPALSHGHCEIVFDDISSGTVHAY